MNITFLGTCACDFSKKLENEFKDCFDKNARRSSAMLIDDAYLVDCGPHTLDALRIANKDASKITDIFVTHLHKDHFNTDNINAIAGKRSEQLRLWVREDAKLNGLENVTVMPMPLFSSCEVAPDFKVTGLIANHDQNACPQHLLFEKNGKKAFYGCDGAWLINKTYYHLRNKNLNLMVLDCTTGDYLGDFRMGEHNSIPMLRVMLPSLRTFKIVDEQTKVYFSHLAPSLHAPHDETVKIATAMGACVAYDGLELTV